MSTRPRPGALARALALGAMMLPVGAPVLEAGQPPRPSRRPATAAPAAKPDARPSPPKDEATEFVRSLTGHFSNEAQAPLPGISPGGSDTQAQDRLHVHVREVEVLSLPGTVLLVQWNRDRADGPIARQRLWTVVPGGSDRVATLKIYGLRDAETFVDALESPEVLQTLGPEDLFLPADTCELPVTRTADGFLATTLPACPSAVAMSQKTTRFQVRLRVNGAGFTYSEVGYRDPDFTVAFALPRTGGYEFSRVKP